MNKIQVGRIYRYLSDYSLWRVLHLTHFDGLGWMVWLEMFHIGHTAEQPRNQGDFACSAEEFHKHFRGPIYRTMDGTEHCMGSEEGGTGDPPAE